MLRDLSRRARLVSALCPDYPRGLCDLPDAPCVFRIVGELPDFTRAISIVGTRRADEEALDFAYELARHAARSSDHQSSSFILSNFDLLLACR